MQQRNENYEKLFEQLVMLVWQLEWQVIVWKNVQWSFMYKCHILNLIWHIWKWFHLIQTEVGFMKSSQFMRLGNLQRLYCTD